MRKVFGLGLSKTGTSSLGQALKYLGYRVKGPGGATSREIFRGDYARALACIDKYDAFEGMPWSLMTRQLLEWFGTDARYVLTVRRSAEAWLASVRRHMLMRDPIAVLTRPPRPYGRRYPIGFEDEFLDFYHRHNEYVCGMFAAHGAEDALLEVCWETGNGWPELCSFLGHPVPSEPFPQKNVTADRKSRPLRVGANYLCAQAIATFN